MSKSANLKGKKIIVTGGAGFVGSHLCDELIKQEARVFCIDDLSGGSQYNINHLRKKKDFRFIKKSVCSKSNFDSIFKNTDTIFNLAASKKIVCLKNPQRDLNVNAWGTLNMLLLAKKHQVKKFIHSSTGSVYGEFTKFPSSESHSLKPTSYYAVSKLAGENYVNVFNKLYKLNTSVLRYFHVYGSRQKFDEDGQVVSIFIKNILDKKIITIHGTGKQIRSFTWVKDVVNANLLAATKQNSNGQIYNCTSGIQISIEELALGLLKLMDTEKTVKIKYADWALGDVKYFQIDNRKIKKELGIQFETNFWEKMEKTIPEFINYIKHYRCH